MRLPPWYASLAWTWIVLGLLFGAFAMWAAWGENSNEEIYSYSTGEIEWSAWLPLGIGGLIVFGLPPLALTTVVAWIAGRRS